MLAESSPSVVIIARPNGAGKSTLAPYLLRDELAIRDFVNADTIAAGLSGFAPEPAAFEAGRIMFDRMRSLAAGRKSFASETTLSSRTIAAWLHGKLHPAGYRSHLVFM